MMESKTWFNIRVAGKLKTMVENSTMWAVLTTTSFTPLLEMDIMGPDAYEVLGYTEERFQQMAGCEDLIGCPSPSQPPPLPPPGPGPSPPKGICMCARVRARTHTHTHTHTHTLTHTMWKLTTRRQIRCDQKHIAHHSAGN